MSTEFEDWLDGPGAPTLAGDPTDDDADYVNDLVNAQALPVQPPETTMVTRVEVKPRNLSRLFTGYQTFTDALAAPQLILNPDPRRVNLILRCFGTGANDYLLIANDRSKLEYVGLFSGGAILQTSRDYTFSEYTGPVWVRPSGLTAASILMTWAAVTY